MSDYVRFGRLVQSFHALAHAPCFARDGECDLRRLDKWAFAEDGERLDGLGFAAAFCLNLWSRNGHGVVWAIGDFDMFEALMQWDDRHRRAWQAWAADPWRP